MRRIALVAVLLLTAAACSPSVSTGTSTGSGTEFPVTVEADNGSVTIDERPVAIISLSPVATEMLFEIGAGPQVVAVDDQSNYPADAPRTELSGYTPNLEAILSFGPDLVVITFDAGDLVAGLETAGVAVIPFGAAATIDDAYGQIAALGAATGNIGGAAKANADIRARLDAVVAESGGSGTDLSYYHEIDALLYSVTSSTFFGEIYGLFGMVNIADPADAEGFGYPQLSSEHIVASDPNIIFLADVLYGESAETVAVRPGWAVMTAIQSGDIVELDSDIASRWGPRIVDLAEAIADAIKAYAAG